MQYIQRIVRAFDAFQQHHPVLGFPIAVFIKFGEEQAANQAALIAYYGFLSLFPLLLVIFTLIPMLIGSNTALEHRIIDAVVSYIPVVGGELQDNIHSAHHNGIGLVIGALITLYGARGVANAIQNASNAVWQVPLYKRPGFPWNTLRSLGIIVGGGAGLIVATAGVGYITSLWHGGWPVRGLLFVAALVLNWLVFWGVFRLATAKQVATGQLCLGAALAAIFWQALQIGGSFLLLHELKNTSAVYGVFAVVLGLVFWLYLQAELYVYAMEVNVVKAGRLWPRSIAAPPLTEADKRTYERYALTEQRKKETSINIEFKK